MNKVQELIDLIKSEELDYDLVLLGFNDGCLLGLGKDYNYNKGWHEQLFERINKLIKDKKLNISITIFPIIWDEKFEDYTNKDDKIKEIFKLTILEN